LFIVRPQSAKKSAFFVLWTQDSD